jgi:hypothetical protein
MNESRCGNIRARSWSYAASGSLVSAQLRGKAAEGAAVLDGRYIIGHYEDEWSGPSASFPSPHRFFSVSPNHYTFQLQMHFDQTPNFTVAAGVLLPPIGADQKAGRHLSHPTRIQCTQCVKGHHV